MWVHIWKERLPSAYQEVEYIRWSSSWWQYIDTGMANVTNKTKVEYSYIPYSDNEWIIFMDTTWGSSWFGNGWRYYYYWGYYSNTFTNVIWERVTFIIAKDWCYRNWANKVTMSADITPPWTVLLFANRRWWNIDGTPWKNCSLYYYKRWESWVLTQEFVPCYRKSDNVIWMYDLVNDTFYTNSWSWTFSKWPDVNYVEYELKNAYIGEVKEYSYDFRNKSVSYVQDAWWTISNTSTLDFWANWVKATNNNNCTWTKSIDYSKAKTIEIEATVYLETWDKRWAIISWPCLTTSWDNNFALWRIWSSTYINRIIDNIGNYQWSGWEDYYSWTPSDWSQTLKIVFDLSAKTMTSYRILNWNSISKVSNLSDTQVSNIRACPYWRVEFDAWTWWAYLSDLSIIIE